MNDKEYHGPDTPYKGLMPYQEEDAAFFFGREAERRIITANGASSVPGLVKALQRGNAYTRLLATKLLGEMGPSASSAVSDLAGSLENSTEPHQAILRAEVVRSIGRIGPAARGAIPAVTSALEDRDPHVRLAAAVALKKIKGQEGRER